MPRPCTYRPTARPAYLDAVQQLDLASLSPVASGDALLALLGSPTIASKRWVYRQYDHMVRTNTIVLAGMGAGVVRVKGTSRALAMSVDGNGRYCYLDPRRGAMLAVDRGVAQCRMRGRDSDRRHELLELWQSRTTGDHVAAG